MKFSETGLGGAFLIDLNLLEDERGFFARAFCTEELKEYGLKSEVLQANISWNKHKGTLRGMHFQRSPFQETKLIRCTQGALYDVIIDLRADSSTYRESFGVELTAQNRKALFVPCDFAHGFITLEDCTEAFYMVSEAYHQDAESGIRWNDKSFDLDWPIEPKIISDKDANWADYEG